MSLNATAQALTDEIFVEDLPSEQIVLTPIAMPAIHQEMLEDICDPESEEDLECFEPKEQVLEIVIDGLGDIPGLHSHLDPEKEKDLEVSEDDDEEKDKSDANDSKKPKKDERWDWESKGPDGFVAWVDVKFKSVPKHSGYDSSGIERAISYLEKLDNEISKAMRLDLDGELDSDKVEDIRSKIEDGIERLHDRLDKIKSKKKKKKKAGLAPELIKEAQKITGVQGIYVTVPLLISRIARVCINGSVSAGHDLEDLFQNQVKKYKLNDREQAETIQLMEDMGYPIRRDRGLMTDEDFDPAGDNFDFVKNYKG